MMNGVALGEIVTALADAYDRDDLKRMLRFHMNERFDHLIRPAAFQHEVFDLVEWAERHGRDAELIQAAYRDRPGNPRIGAVYEKYGLAVSLDIQSAGQTIPGSPQLVTSGGLERTIRPNSPLIDLAVWRERQARVEGQVCRVQINGRAAGTGFLIGPDLVLTNHHVLDAVLAGTTSPTAVTCQFDYKKFADGTRTDGREVALAAEWLVDASPPTLGEASGDPDRTKPGLDELDHAVIRLAEPIGAMPIGIHAGVGAPIRGWVDFPDPSTPCQPDMPLIIVQHPDGGPMKMALDFQSVLSVTDTRVRYATRTEPGSSGSPCFDLEWRLVALHHYGDPAYRQAEFNQGIPVRLIQDRLPSTRWLDADQAARDTTLRGAGEEIAAVPGRISAARALPPPRPPVTGQTLVSGDFYAPSQAQIDGHQAVMLKLAFAGHCKVTIGSKGCFVYGVHAARLHVRSQGGGHMLDHPDFDATRCAAPVECTGAGKAHRVYQIVARQEPLRGTVLAAAGDRGHVPLLLIDRQGATDAITVSGVVEVDVDCVAIDWGRSSPRRQPSNDADKVARMQQAVAQLILNEQGARFDLDAVTL